MSLLLDVLRRFRTPRRRTSIPPALLKERTKKGRKGLIFVGGAFGLSAVVAYFLTNQLLTGFQTPKIGRPAEQVVFSEPETIEELPSPEEQPVIEEPQREEPVIKPEKAEVPKEKVAKVEPKEEIKKITEDIKSKTPSVITLEDPTTYLLLADRHFREGNLPKSREYYEKAYSLRKSLKVANNLVVVAVRMGDLKRAEEIVEETKSEKVAYTYLIELSKQNLQEEAVKRGEKYSSLDKKGFISFALGYAYETLGEYGKALENYKRAYDKDPYNPYFAYNYARLLDYTGDYMSAFRIYSKLKGLELDPKIKRAVEERLRQLRAMGFGG